MSQIRSALAALVVLTLAAAVSGPARAEDSPTGFATAFDYSAEMFSNLAGGQHRGTVFAGLAHLAFEDVGESWSAHADIYAPHGDSLSDREVGDFSVLSNIVTVNQLRLHEAWLQRGAGAWSVRAGLVAADSEFWGSDSAAVFVSSAFGAPSVVSGNLPNPNIFPQGVPGVRLAFDLGQGQTLRVAAYDGGAGDLVRDNRHGLNIDGGPGALLVAEYQRDLGSDDAGTTQLRAGGFYHSGNFVDPHGRSVRGDAGLVALIDHAIDPRLSIFARIGAAQANRNTVPWSFETGINLTSVFAAKDRLGIGLAYVNLDSIPSAPVAREALRHEVVLETTLNWPLNDSVSLQPDLQYIVDPGGTFAARNALVAGLRLIIQ